MTTQVPVKEGYIQGRNGLYDLKELKFWLTTEGNRVHIDGIGKRGQTINGGLAVDLPAFLNACIEFLKHYYLDDPIRLQALESLVLDPIKTSYLNNSFVCPFCGGHALTAGESDDSETAHVQEISCDHCDKRWTDVYVLTDIEFEEEITPADRIKMEAVRQSLVGKEPAKVGKIP